MLYIPTPTEPDPDDPLGLFGDGPPHWMEGKKPEEYESFSAGEARLDRDMMVPWLSWQANRAAFAAGNETPTSLAALALADKLDACVPPQFPCLSGACPVCMRAQQRWLVKDTMCVLEPLVQDTGCRPQVLSLVPEFGTIPVGSTETFDIDLFCNTIGAALTICGIDHFKLGLHISLNQRAGHTRPGWQFHFWGFFFHEPKARWRGPLKALLNPNGGGTWPVKVVKPSSLEAAAAYGLRSTFVRRNLDRQDRGECWNTRGAIWRGETFVELMLFLDRIGLQRRILLSERSLSVPPLHSQNDPRLGGSK